MRHRSRTLTLTCLVATAAALVGSGASTGCSSSSSEPAAAIAEADAEAGTLDPDAAAPDGAAPDAPSAVIDGTVLASGLAGLAGVAASETDVYVVSRTTGVVHVVPLEGGPVAQLAAPPELPSPSGIVFVDASVYWIDLAKKMLARRDAAGGAVETAAVSGGLAPQAIAAGFAAGVRSIVLAATDPNDHGDIQQHGPTLGAAQTLQQSLVKPFDVAVTGTQVAWTESGPGSIWTGQLGSTSAAQLVLSEPGCESIAADAQGIYWTRPAEGLVRMTVAPGGTPVTSLGKTELGAFSLAADDSGVYWLTEDGKLRRSTRTELPPETMSKGFASVFADRHVQAIALTSKYVVWITSDGSVVRHAK
jgi:hypothetical protein